MIYIIDLDYTIFDTTRFTQDLAKCLKLSYGDFVSQVDEFFTSKGNNYSLVEHTKFIQVDAGVEIEHLFARCDDYLFAGVEKFLQSAKNNNTEIILLTAGNENYQKKKVNNLSVKKIFDKIVYVKNSVEKVEIVTSLAEKIYIINDNAKETLLMKQSVDECEALLILGPYSKNVKHNLKTIKPEDFFIKY